MEAFDLSRQSPDRLPARCLNPKCNFEFLGYNPISVGGNSSNIVVTGTKISCPKCHSLAQQVDWKIDSSGKFQLTSLLSSLKSQTDTEKLNQFKSNIEAANDADEINAHELIDALEEVNPRFSQYREYIKSIPIDKLGAFTNLLLQVVMVIVTLVALSSQNEANSLSSEANSIQEEALEFEKEKFEYEKAQDDKKLLELERKLEELVESIDSKPNHLDTNLSDKSQPSKLKPSCTIKGNMRNKPCPCGSNKKAKKCHPYGLNLA
ncbi:SEC-C metal-binding domain-containing protein [Vibrio cyclitrophicus]